MSRSTIQRGTGKRSSRRRAKEPESGRPRGGREEEILVSVVVPAHDEEENIAPLFERIREALAVETRGWEVVIVDDGSRDATWTRIGALARETNRVVGVKLSRNFGHQSALLAGLEVARGKAVVCMDADLQHPPSLIPVLLEEWRMGAKVVSTRRRDAASTSRFKRATSRLFYRVLSSLASERMVAGMSDFCLLDRQVVQEICRLGEVRAFLRGIVQWVGFPSSCVPYQAGDRLSGRSKYGFGRMIDLAVTGITSMSTRPLRLSILAALFAALCGLGELAYVTYVALILQASVPGWASTLVVVSFFFTLLFLNLGVFGEYLARVSENVKARPRFIVEATVGTAHSKAEEAHPAKKRVDVPQLLEEVTA